MRVTINGRGSEMLSTGQERLVLLSSEATEVGGTVITGEAAMAAILRNFSIAAGCFGGFALLLLGGFAVLGPPANRGMFLVMLAIAIVALPIVFIVSYRQRRQHWLTHLRERLVGLPPPGTRVRLDAAGVHLGDRAIAWSDLSVRQLDLLAMSRGRSGKVYLVNRLLLQTPGDDLALDRALTRNGEAIVNCAYRRLCRGHLQH